MHLEASTSWTFGFQLSLSLFNGYCWPASEWKKDRRVMAYRHVLAGSGVSTIVACVICILHMVICVIAIQVTTTTTAGNSPRDAVLERMPPRRRPFGLPSIGPRKLPLDSLYSDEEDDFPQQQGRTRRHKKKSRNSRPWRSKSDTDRKRESTDDSDKRSSTSENQTRKRIDSEPKSKSSRYSISDFAIQIRKILKELKYVSQGSDKSKGLYPDDLQYWVFRELDIRDNGTSEDKEMFRDALKRMEGKEEIKFNQHGKVKLIISNDHSQRSRTDDDEKKRSRDDDSDDDSDDDLREEKRQQIKEEKKKNQGQGENGGNDEKEKESSGGEDEKEKGSTGDKTKDENRPRPAQLDFDGDGVDNDTEKQAGTDPEDPTDRPKNLPSAKDKDGDGLSDILEKAIGSDPRDVDSDMDGADDLSEYVIGNNPADKRDRPSVTPNDEDGDGLSSVVEKAIGSDPKNADSDGDNVPDGIEYVEGSDPSDAKDRPSSARPGDGDEEAHRPPSARPGNGGEESNRPPSARPGGEEEEYDRPTSTRPGTGSEESDNAGQGSDKPGSDLLAGDLDTDRDGVDDLTEMLQNTDPKDAASKPSQIPDDPDGDNLTSILEDALGTDNNIADSDGDGYSDGEEYVAGSDPLDASNTPLFVDSDNDGVSDVDEIKAGFDPNDPNSTPQEQESDREPIVGGEPSSSPSAVGPLRPTYEPTSEPTMEIMPTPATPNNTDNKIDSNGEEQYRGSTDVPYSFQISTGGEDLTPEDIADLDASLSVLSQRLVDENFPMESRSRMLSDIQTMRRLIVMYNENEPARVIGQPEQGECLESSEADQCYDVNAETTLTLIDEDEDVVRDEFRNSMNEAIADGQLQDILLDINPNTNISVLGPIDASEDDKTNFPNVDRDGDGFSDFEEVQAGTDPNDATDKPSTDETIEKKSACGTGCIVGASVGGAALLLLVTGAAIAGRKRRNNTSGSVDSLDSSFEDDLPPEGIGGDPSGDTGGDYEGAPLIASAEAAEASETDEVSEVFEAPVASVELPSDSGGEVYEDEARDYDDGGEPFDDDVIDVEQVFDVEQDYEASEAELFEDEVQDEEAPGKRDESSKEEDWG